MAQAVTGQVARVLDGCVEATRLVAAPLAAEGDDGDPAMSGRDPGVLAAQMVEAPPVAAPSGMAASMATPVDPAVMASAMGGAVVGALAMAMGPVAAVVVHVGVVPRAEAAPAISVACAVTVAVAALQVDRGEAAQDAAEFVAAGTGGDGGQWQGQGGGEGERQEAREHGRAPCGRGEWVFPGMPRPVRPAMTRPRHRLTPRALLLRRHSAPIVAAMRLLFSAAVLTLAATGAQAACYADYKAKQDAPLRLHYGVIELPDAACSVAGAEAALRERLDDGWQLLQVTGVFGPEGLESRRDSAGAYFLRY